MQRPRAKIDIVTADVRVVGVLFTMLGLIPLLILAAGGVRQSILARLMAIIDTIILVGPGVWYAIATTLMRRGNFQALVTSRRIVLIQLVVVPVCLLLGFYLERRGDSEARVLIVPAMLAVFFIPALLALLYVLRRVRITMLTINPAGHAFQVLPVAVTPIDPADPQSE